MLNIQKYISSGIIENYCLGTTTEAENQALEMYCLKYPAIQKALDEQQELLENYLSKFEVKTPSNARQRILDAIENEKLTSVTFNEKTGLLTSFLNISQNSETQKWEELTQQISPPEDLDIHSHLLYKDSKNLLAVVWIKELLPDEIHTNKIEQFLILEGTCTCQLGNKEIKMQKGSFLEIPLHVVHNIKVTSNEPLKLILTKRKVA